MLWWTEAVTDAVCAPSPHNVGAIMPGLLGPGDRSWFPTCAQRRGDPTVLLVLDGLGWNQLQDRIGVLPHLAGLDGGPITTVAPSTTAAALTSITTGTTPGEHGLIGYRIRIGGEVLNALRWTTSGADARTRIVPSVIQPVPAFLGERPPVVARTEFATSGFTAAHLAGSPYVGWRMPSTLVAETAELVRSGHRFVYAYYDGIDKVAHEYGFSLAYDCEVAAADWLVGALLSALPSGTVLLVTADHGQVQVGDRVRLLDASVTQHCASQSGEGRFRWLHARSGHEGELLEVARAQFDSEAWVVSDEQVLDERWFGGHVTSAARSRLGQVALVAREPVAFHDADDSGPFQLICRHGSLTPDEMLVPLLAGRVI